MCLSTVYYNELKSENIAMQNVMRIDCADGTVTLTDLMDRQTTIPGTLLYANLVEGCAVIQTA